MRCKECKGPVHAVDYMPRIIAIAGEVAEWDFTPEERDEDWYEASVTVGFACDGPLCPNHIGPVLVYDAATDSYIAESNKLEDIAEDGDPEE